MSKTILIMAGGTGGHIFPALAIAKALKSHSVNVEWLGSKHGMENTLVPKHNIKLHSVNAVGLRGKSALTLIKAPFSLSLAVLQTLRVFFKVKPSAVLGMGGFASGIGGLVAWVLRIPLIIHEQNSIPGTTNKMLSRIATQTFQAFDGAFDNAITTGNPVLFKPKENRNNHKKLNLLIVGGSLGSKPINDIVSQLNIDIEIWHQTGKQHLDNVKAQYANKNAKITAFIDDMADAYAWADVVLCRAGAMTVSELMLSAKPSILIPLPHAIDNHQFYNAKILADNNAGILIEQKALNIELLTSTLTAFNTEKLNVMSKNAKKLAKPNAAKVIGSYLYRL
ncbi:UDP-N-acetylglucosamine--N-acetylmuramyl-(pentapeptide) pyrophosphoryl-undecaprenol N-acetylglucosamine transferase [Bathymodiolus thermophilus thioautotrophic gill symbiont]|uniref:undecaprenyldiphospho-muramoylpentapeptide beta-N-acetylglucosaminyltransferase n=1 Tax=Bathymodiolus thermophilus thioautotrophic gill symbiont TaxID=2360 RepID=UPI0010B07A20|nr:undecaprenyldiphospho-muramoylpentapeptide beta-N-acetylglucosaminyltransferase [Bathymodiolus thermophilus thioautotrophic gill symbiont]SHA26959.1 UDP-N-acetylglucosamine--N-acetylmuramyl-(pentapeptide) pyrophosphoryl-undecaprenol N-acetylglucosamine transferase [Bathymodiolus thermophilus thioautotrophic gill symbiont]